MRILLFSAVVCFFVFPFSPTVLADTEQVSVHFLNVGQADCILVQTSTGKNVLIDSGDNAHTQKVIDYLKERGVEKIDMFIATHPHHDHIGSVDELFETFEIHMLYMPPLSNNTRDYHRLKKAVAENEIIVMTARAGQTIRLARDIRIDVLAPLGKNYAELNDYSLVLKLTHGKNRFLFTADAGSRSESEIIEKGLNIKADVLKISHHGADSGTSKVFLKKVDPEYAIISTGHKDNNFPSDKVIGRLKKQHVTIFRTDRHGTIVAVSDGESITFRQNEVKYFLEKR